MLFDKKSLYARLGLPEDASAPEIRRAYRDAAQRLHPDKNVQPGETELFLGIQEAYEILSDPERRAKYDSTRPKSTSQPIIFDILYSRDTLQYGKEPQLIYALLEMKAPQLPEKETKAKPLNVCLLVDCSTSMQGTLMDTVKATAIELVNQLKPQDILSVVAFSDRAEVLLPASKYLNAREAKNAIQMLRASGGTEMYQGLDAAFSEILQQRDANRVNHIVMLSDGRTYGDDEKCIDLAKQASLQRVGISGLGLGNDWNDELLDKLAKLTGGSTTYVKSAQEIRNFLTEKFDNLSKRYAENITYNFDISPGVQLRYAFRIQPEASPLETNSPMQIGGINREGDLQVLMELLVESIQPTQNTLTLLSGHVNVQVPFRHDSQVNLRLELTRPCSAEVNNDVPPAMIVQAMSRLTLYRIQERAKENIAQGNIEEATRQLQNIATHLLADGNMELARTVMEEIDHIQESQNMSKEGSKNIKYGTRNLLLSDNKQ